MPPSVLVESVANETTSSSSATKKRISNGLLDRLGGEDTLEFAVVNLCERIRKDPELRPFYKTFDSESLILLQRECILLALSSSSSSSSSKSSSTSDSKSSIALAKSRLALRHYRLLDMGLDQSHLDKVASHFEAALLDSWVPPNVIHDVRSKLASFQFLNTTLQQHSPNGGVVEDRMAKSCRGFASGGSGSGSRRSKKKDEMNSTMTTTSPPKSLSKSSRLLLSHTLPVSSSSSSERRTRTLPSRSHSMGTSKQPSKRSWKQPCATIPKKDKNDDFQQRPPRKTRSFDDIDFF